MIPGYTSTGSKRPTALFGRDIEVPGRMVRANGCRVWDEHGREYVDTIMALGAVALGYGHPAVTTAAVRAARDGVVGPLAPRAELQLAEKLVDVLTGMAWTRFFKTGAEAVQGAVRIARVETGRDRVLSCGYHGWLDWCSTGPGVPSAVASLRREIPFNDVDALRTAMREFGPVACIVVEPVIDGPPTREWLTALRDETRHTGTCLVFDEIKTAFRLARGGIAELTGVVPDLQVLGKAMGNGYPIAAVAGVAGLEDAATRTWISSTLATEYVSLAAAGAVIDVFASDDVVARLAQAGNRLWATFVQLTEGFPEIVKDVRGVPTMSYVLFDTNERSAAVARAGAERALLFKRNAYNFVSLAHDDAEIDVIADRLTKAVEDAA